MSTNENGQQVLEVKVGEHFEEIINALYSILNVMSAMAHGENLANPPQPMGAIFLEAVKFVESRLGDRPNVGLAKGLLGMFIQEPEPQKPRPMLKIVR